MPVNSAAHNFAAPNQVVSILQSVKNYDRLDVTEETKLIDNLGFTSLDVMNFIIALEQGFHITFQDEHLDLEHFVTFGAVLETLRSYPIESL